MTRSTVGISAIGGTRVAETAASSAREAMGAAARLIELDQPLGALARDVVRSGVPFWFLARGGSMSPAIPDRTMVRLRPESPDLVRRGDVVLAQCANGRCVLHRVHRLLGTEGFVLIGDSNSAPDAPMRWDSLLGVVDRVVMDGRELPVRERPGPRLRVRLRRARVLCASLTPRWRPVQFAR